jgi:hypothetical protein
VNNLEKQSYQDPFMVCENMICGKKLSVGYVTLITTRHVRRFCCVECIHEGQQALYDSIAREVAEVMSDADIELKLIDVIGTKVPSVSRTFQGFGYLTVEVGTEAGDDDGDVTVIVLKPTGSFSCRASLGLAQAEMEIGESSDADSIRIVVRGHSERELLSQACGFVAKTLRAN